MMQSGKFFAIVFVHCWSRINADATPVSLKYEVFSKSAEEVSQEPVVRQAAQQPQPSRTEVAVEADGSFATVASTFKAHELGTSGRPKSEKRHDKHSRKVQETLMPDQASLPETVALRISSLQQSSDTAQSKRTHHGSADPKARAEEAEVKATAPPNALHGSMLSETDAAKVQGIQQYAKYLFFTVGLALVAVSFFTAYGRFDIPDVILGWIACTLYLVLALSIDMLISKAKSNGITLFSFEPACVVILVELGKFVVSAGLFGLSRVRPMVNGEPLLSEKFSLTEVAWLSLPAVLFLFSNILAFQAIGANDMASFGVFRDTVLLWNAAIWCVVFQVTLSFHRILALLGIFFGLCINQITPLLSASWSPAILLVCTMALMNACASVAQEFALKRNMALDINLQNCVSCIFGMLAGVMYLGVTSPAKLSSSQAFFEGFDTLTFMLVSLLLTLSLLVVRILKYANSVMKSIMQSLRGPLIVLIAPTLGLQSRTDTLAYVSAIIVSSSACFFLLQGKPKMEKSMSANPENKDAEK